MLARVLALRSSMQLVDPPLVLDEAGRPPAPTYRRRRCQERSSKEILTDAIVKQEVNKHPHYTLPFTRSTGKEIAGKSLT